MPLYLRLILITGPPGEVQAAERAHAEEVERLRTQGKLRASGRLRRDEGFCEVIETADLHEAESLARANPLIAAGLASWILRELDRFET